MKFKIGDRVIFTNVKPKYKDYIIPHFLSKLIIHSYHVDNYRGIEENHYMVVNDEYGNYLPESSLIPYEDTLDG